MKTRVQMKTPDPVPHVMAAAPAAPTAPLPPRAPAVPASPALSTPFDPHTPGLKPLPRYIVDNSSVSRLALRRSGVALERELRHLPAKVILTLAHAGVRSLAELTALDTAAFRRVLPERLHRDAVRRALVLADLPIPSALDWRGEGPT